MGNSYVNVSVKTENRDWLVAGLSNVSDPGVVGPLQNGWITFSSQALETRDDTIIDQYGNPLSEEMGIPAIAVTNHDDDVLMVSLYEGGKRTAFANSDPGYFAGADSPPEIDGADRLAALRDGVTTDHVSELLGADHVFAVEAHAKLAQLLGLPAYSVGFGHGYASRGDFDHVDGLESFGQ